YHNMMDAKGVCLRPRRLRTKIEQRAPESLTPLPSRFVLIHMWWNEDLRPLYSVQPDANPRRHGDATPKKRSESRFQVVKSINTTGCSDLERQTGVSAPLLWRA